MRRAPLELMPVPAKESDSAPMLRLPPTLFVVSSKAEPLTITVPLLVVPRPLSLPTRMAPALFVTMPVKVLAAPSTMVPAPALVRPPAPEITPELVKTFAPTSIVPLPVSA